MVQEKISFLSKLFGNCRARRSWKNFLHNNSTKDAAEDRREWMFRRDSFPSFAKPSVRRTVIATRENLSSTKEERIARE